MWLLVPAHRRVPAQLAARFSRCHGARQQRGRYSAWIFFRIIQRHTDCIGSGILTGQLLGQRQNQLLGEFVSRTWPQEFFRDGVAVGLYFCSSFGFEFICPELQGQTLDVLIALAAMFILLPLYKLPMLSAVTYLKPAVMQPTLLEYTLAHSVCSHCRW